jgi:hypothetical protein
MSQLSVNGQALTPTNWTEVLKPSEVERDTLLNLLGDINKMRKWMEKVESYVKEALPSKFVTPEFEYATSYYHFQRTAQSRISLDGDKIKAEMLAELGEDAYKDWLREHSKVTEYFQINIKEIKP